MGRALVAAVVAGLVAGCAPLSSGGRIAKLDARNGFRDARFGMPVSAIPNLEPVDSRNGFDCYVRANEDLTIGEATLSQIRYCFYRDRLATVVMSGLGVSATQELLRSLRASYGNGEPLPSRVAGAAPVGEIWRGKRATAMLVFVQSDTFALSVTGDVAVSIWSNEIVAQRDAQMGGGGAR